MLDVERARPKCQERPSPTLSRPVCLTTLQHHTSSLSGARGDVSNLQYYLGGYYVMMLSWGSKALSKPILSSVVLEMLCWPGVMVSSICLWSMVWTLQRPQWPLIGQVSQYWPLIGQWEVTAAPGGQAWSPDSTGQLEVVVRWRHTVSSKYFSFKNLSVGIKMIFEFWYILKCKV